MQASIMKIFENVTQRILGLTLYDMMRSSDDFEDVKDALNDRTDWCIELFRSCFTIHLSNGGYFFMLCAVFFLIMAESIRVHYGRLSPAELKERVERIGYATFAIIVAMLDVGSVIVRIAGLFALSGSPALAANLTLVSMSPSIILPLLAYPVRLLKRKRRQSTGEVEAESGTVVDGAGTGTERRHGGVQ